MAADKQAGTAERIAAENELTRALFNLQATAEAYPQLQANQNFMDLQHQLQDLEQKIAYASVLQRCRHEAHNASRPSRAISAGLFHSSRRITSRWTTPPDLPASEVLSRIHRGSQVSSLSGPRCLQCRGPWDCCRGFSRIVGRANMQNRGNTWLNTIAIMVAVTLVAAAALVLTTGWTSSPDLSYRSVDYQVKVMANGDLRITEHIDVKLQNRDKQWRQLYQRYTLIPTNSPRLRTSACATPLPG